MRFNQLDDWLEWQETLNPAEIELGLDRISTVLAQAGLADKFPCPLITVAGTNGKGSVVAILEAIAISAGLRVCSYTSPHVFKYNERIKFDGQPVGDAVLCDAFDRIDRARCAGTQGEVPLTYFEFGTLAAIDLFHRQRPDIVLFEVGLGGRLDATNIMEPDVSVLTSVAIDHVDWLGSDRESIGFEKAGIFRAGKMVVCGEPDPPVSVLQHAQQLGCRFLRVGKDYDVLDQPCYENDLPERKVTHTWDLRSCLGDMADLPMPGLVGDFQKRNAATAIVAIQALIDSDQLHKPGSNKELSCVVSDTQATVNLVGRYQTVHRRPRVIVDVAHNPHAAQTMAGSLTAEDENSYATTWAIIAMLSDKDVDAVVEAVAGNIDRWCLAGLSDVKRGLSTSALTKRFISTGAAIDPVLNDKLERELDENQCTILSAEIMAADTVSNACRSVLTEANKNDRVIIFGSFYTVAEAIEFFKTVEDD